MTIFDTSDTHFNHKNIIQYCNRPFKDMDHMRECLIKNWNDVVGINDIVYHNGDFAMGGSLEIHVPAILSRLNGTKILIKGNHDHPVRTCQAVGWHAVYESVLLPKPGIKQILEEEGYDGNLACDVLIRHYNPDSVTMWPGHENGVVLLHGHSHGHSHGFTPRQNSLDCGVDVWDYKPIKLAKAIIEALKKPEERECRG